MGHTFKDFQDLQCLVTILQARLKVPEFALMQAYFNKQVNELNSLKAQLGAQKHDHDTTYESLQDVIETRDTLLKHIYHLLGAPNGILLKDMPAAINKQLAGQARLVQTCKRLAVKSYEKHGEPVSRGRRRAVSSRTLGMGPRQARHDQKIGELYGELSELYTRLSTRGL